MFRPTVLFAVSLSCLVLLGGCVRYENRRGVEVVWRAEVVDKLRVGVSTRAEVLDALGPPSQVISLEEETVLYYLFERAAGEGIVLVVYTAVDIETRYDRAIFFFDENDVLKDYATRIHGRDDG